MDIHQDLQTRAEIVEERDALAALVTDLRRALEKIAEQCRPETQGNTSEGLLAQACVLSLETADCALSLPLPAAAEQVKVEREYCDATLEYMDDRSCVGTVTARFDAALSALRAARGAK